MAFNFKCRSREAGAATLQKTITTATTGGSSTLTGSLLAFLLDGPLIERRAKKWNCQDHEGPRPEAGFIAGKLNRQNPPPVA